MNSSDLTKLNHILEIFEDGLTQVESAQNNFFPISTFQIRKEIKECYICLKKEETRIIRQKAMRKVRKLMNTDKVK